MQWARHVVKTRKWRLCLSGRWDIFAISDDSNDDGFFLHQDHIHSEVSALYIGAKKDLVKPITLKNCFLLASWLIHCDWNTFFIDTKSIIWKNPLLIKLTNGLHLLADCVAGTVDFSPEFFSCPNCYLALNDFLEITPSSAKSGLSRTPLDWKKPAFYSVFYDAHGEFPHWAERISHYWHIWRKTLSTAGCSAANCKKDVLS